MNSKRCFKCGEEKPIKKTSRELIEARELLCNHLIELQECRKTLSAYGHSSNWMAEIDRLIKRTREYLGE